MRAVIGLWAITAAFLGVIGGAAAADCSVDRDAAERRIDEATRALERELDPYEIAVRSGDIDAFESRVEPVVWRWEALFRSIHEEQQRVAAIPCPVEGIPNEYRLPADWDMVRDLGVRRIIDLDRAIADLNAGVRHARPSAQGFGPQSIFR